MKGNFDKVEDFKPLPKKLNSSIHESDSSKKPTYAHRSIGEDQSYEIKRNSVTGADNRYSYAPNASTSIDEESFYNSKRQELS